MIFRCWEIEGVKVPAPVERILTIIMSPEATNTRQLTLLTSVIPSGSSTGAHQHEVNEFMYVASGRGEFIEEGYSISFEPDCILFGPAHKEHEIKNIGKETVKLICIYSPPLKPTGYLEKATEFAKAYFNKKLQKVV